MAGLDEIALAFCRECLDWEDARLTADGGVEVPDSDQMGVDLPRLDPRDLNAVLATAVEWCEQWDVPMSWQGGGDMRRTIMPACLEAHRKLVG
jgi:hypothetical protein